MVAIVLKPFSAGWSGRLNIEASAYRAASDLMLVYHIQGNVTERVVPAPALSQRCDGLWKHTCAELFVALPEHDAYCEFNFAPSTAWAAYRFDGYRTGMQALDCVAPKINVWHDSQALHMAVQCTLPAPWATARTLQLGITMVIEDAQGQCSYWALRHCSERPDFHARDSFVLTVQGP